MESMPSQDNRREKVLSQFLPISSIYKNKPLLRKQIVLKKLREAPMPVLQEACRVCNCDIDKLMALLGV